MWYQARRKIPSLFESWVTMRGKTVKNVKRQETVWTWQTWFATGKSPFKGQTTNVTLREIHLKRNFNRNNVENFNCFYEFVSVSESNLNKIFKWIYWNIIQIQSASSPTLTTRILGPHTAVYIVNPIHWPTSSGRSSNRKCLECHAASNAETKNFLQCETKFKHVFTICCKH